MDYFRYDLVIKQLRRYEPQLLGKLLQAESRNTSLVLAFDEKTLDGSFLPATMVTFSEPMLNAVILGTGFYVPERIVTNDDLKAYYDTSDDWIWERSGIRERRWVPEGVDMGASDLAKPAAEMAIREAGLVPQDIDLVVFATLSPDAHFPGSGCFLQAKMGLGTIPCLDIRMQCSGFIYGLSIADAYIRAGVYRNVLVIGSEVQSTGLDLSPEGRTVGVLFGDGAGAAVVSARAEPGRGIHSYDLHTQGEHARVLWNEEPTSNRRPRLSPDPESKAIFP
jgi:3-oxoacyl-[acyl-carrier-protein] synthase III